VIPHTTDIDIAMTADEYDERIDAKFLGNPLVYLRQTLGKKKYSYEMRFLGCDFVYDIFILYKLSPKKYCNYFHSESVAP
jgi:hypothetical protein